MGYITWKLILRYVVCDEMSQQTELGSSKSLFRGSPLSGHVTCDVPHQENTSPDEWIITKQACADAEISLLNISSQYSLRSTFKYRELYKGKPKHSQNLKQLTQLIAETGFPIIIKKSVDEMAPCKNQNGKQSKKTVSNKRLDIWNKCVCCLPRMQC